MMKQGVRWLGCLLLFCGVALVGTTTAWAQTAKTPDFSAHPEIEDLAGELEELWMESPEAFVRLDATRSTIIEEHVQSGYRPMNVARYLEGLGEHALLPMLWALVADDPRDWQMDLRTWRIWRIGLLEAVGRLRDERSIDVLKSSIESEPFPSVRKAATSALGRLDDEASIKDVIAFAQSSPEKRSAIVAGLGDARRHVALEYLVEVLASTDDVEEQRVAVRALGDWGNQWAWSTSSRQPYQVEGQKGRQMIVDQLVDRYPTAAQPVRAEIKKSLQLAGAEKSKQRAQQLAAESSDEEIRALLQKLVAAMADSPMD